MHVLFDLDGTLSDPKPGFVRSIAFAFSEIGFELDPEIDLASYIGPPIHDTFDKLFPDRELAQSALKLYRQRYAEVGLFENELYAGIAECLERVSAAAESVHVATSKPTVFSERIVEHFGLSQYFDVVYGSNLDGSLSDKTELLDHILEQQGIEAQNAVMIGDRRYDMIGARNHGLKALGVLWGYGTEDELRGAGAHHICSHPGEIYDHIFG